MFSRFAYPTFVLKGLMVKMFNIKKDVMKIFGKLIGINSYIALLIKKTTILTK